MPSREELADCFAEDVEEYWQFPVSVTLIKSYQPQKATSNDPTYAISPFRGITVICHNNKAVVTPLQTHLVKWHHDMLCHLGERCPEVTNAYT